jgi:phosphate transport system substrate-binding protein
MRLSYALGSGLVVLIVIIASWFFLVRTDDGDDGPIDGDGNGDVDTDLSLKFTVEEYPRVDGSTSTNPLGVIIACKMLQVPWMWDSKMDGTRLIQANHTDPKYDVIGREINWNLTVHHGTHGSYVNLIEDRSDLILVARQPSDDELDLAANNSVELDVRPIALDAFVFIVNIDNPVQDLTSTQLRNIYTGVITNWTQVGGHGKDINAYQRNENSGSQELMRDLVMQDATMIDAPEMVLWGMYGPINRIAGDQDGIGYSVYFYEEFMARHPNIKLLEVDGVLPTFDNIRTRSYAFTTEVYAVTRKDMDPGSNACQLRDWLLTEEGQSVVKECGYVPILNV